LVRERSRVQVPTRALAGLIDINLSGEDKQCG